MAAIITAIGSVITGFVTWFGAVASALIANDLVLLILGLGVTGLVFAFVMRLVGKIKGGKKRRK